MWIAGICLLSVLMVMVIFLLIPYSPMGSAFARIVSEQTEGAEYNGETFSEQDIVELPLPVQRYFRHCGYLGTPKMSYMKASLKSVDFVMSESKTIKIDYQQLNLVSRPGRFAFISSSIYGIPFEGLDSYENGKGSMQGRLAKIIPLFNQQGEAMDKACLVTWLAECLMAPNAALQDFVNWNEVDDTHAAATVIWEGISAGGVFTFSEEGELLSFRTSDRVAVDMDGKETAADWSAFLRDYRPVNGVLQPRIIQSVWHYEKGDCVYFNENEAPVEIFYQ